MNEPEHDIPPQQEQPPSPNPVRNRGHQLAGRMAAAGSGLLLTSAVALGLYGEKAKSTEEDHCVDPTPAEIAAVKDLLNQPGNQASMKDVMLDAPQTDTRPSRIDIAKENGLTLYDFIGMHKDLIDNINEVDGQTVFNRTQDFLEKYGVDLMLGAEDQLNYAGERVYLPEDLETKLVKEKMLGLIQSFGLLPVEVIQDWGLKKVVFIHMPEDSNMAAYVDVAVDPDTFYVDPERIDLKDFTHEIYHGNDAIKCGNIGMREDKGFNALNPGNIYGDRGDSISNDAYLEFVLEKQPELEAARAAGDEAKIADIKRQIADKAANVVVDSEYSFENVAEDKAELGAQMLNIEDYPEMLDPNKPTLRAKFIFMLGRLFHDDPRIVKYLAAVSSRPAGA